MCTYMYMYIHHMLARVHVQYVKTCKAVPVHMYMYVHVCTWLNIQYVLMLVHAYTHVHR